MIVAGAAQESLRSGQAVTIDNFLRAQQLQLGLEGGKR
jgi:hypothetical protein